MTKRGLVRWNTSATVTAAVSPNHQASSTPVMSNGGWKRDASPPHNTAQRRSTKRTRGRSHASRRSRVPSGGEVLIVPTLGNDIARRLLPG